MAGFDPELCDELEAIRAAGLRRELRRVESPQGPHLEIAGRKLLNFSSNDYLGLANHPALKEAAIHATEMFGAGSGASRLISGSLAPHHELEEALAAFKRTEAALVFSTGHAAALGTLGALAGPGDVVILDKLVHASIVDAARLSGAQLRVFAHNDLDDLDAKLKWASTVPGSTFNVQGRAARVLVVTETVFSMDGDLAPLRNIVELKERHGAWLMIDEAHAIGLFGERRSGVAEAYELSERIEVQMGTLGKAIGASGGYVCGSRALIDLLINRARSFIFSTAPVPAAAAAARAGIELVQSAEGEERRVRVWALVDQLKNLLITAGWPLPPMQSAIVPLIVGDEHAAVQLANALHERGVFAPAIRFPTVKRGRARLRMSVTAAHEPVDLQRLTSALKECSAAFPMSDERPGT
jgi:8-amino-7-oxononanoate synthase